jgi:hypothetical protein
MSRAYTRLVLPHRASLTSIPKAVKNLSSSAKVDAGGLKVWTWVCEHGQLIYRKAVQLPVEGERSSNDR